MFNKKNLFLVGLVFTFVAMQFASALTANSSNYSVSMFGTGMATANMSSTSYQAISLSESKGTTRNAESDTYTVNVGFFDNTVYYRTISITSYSISPHSAVIGSTISLYISALNAQSVWARIVAPNSQEQTIALVNNQFIVYSPPSIVGRYNVTFYASSSTGAIASVVDYFELTAQTTTHTTTPSNGGGSTTTVIEKCTYSWDCTPWGLCADGKQKRECKNTGTCNGTESKPTEEMLCSEALFDITLKFKDLSLTKNKTLKFSVDLTEKMGTGKIDVYIKYTIIDKNNEEMFSQIETRAVERNLTFERETEEIKLTDGEYTLKIEIFYGYQQRASAEQKFKVANGRISIEESILKLQKINVFVFVCIVIIVLFIILLILYLLIKFRKISVRFGKLEKVKRKYLIYPIFALLVIITLTIIYKTNITGRVIENLSSYNWKAILILLIIISIFALLIILRKRFILIYKKIIEFLSEIINKHKKYPPSSIRGLINKKAYLESGDYIGKVNNIILGENKIDKLKIKLDKKYRFKTRGIIIDYKNLKGVGNIVVVDDVVLEKINSQSG